MLWIRVAAVFSADAGFQCGFDAAAFFDGCFHKLADTFGVQGQEGVRFRIFLFDIFGDENADVVAAESKVIWVRSWCRRNKNRREVRFCRK